MRAAVRRLLWSVPIAVTFTDAVASVIRVDGASMQPTLNPARGGGEASGSSSGSSGSGASASASSSTAVPSPSPSAASSAAAAPTRSATSSDWVLVDKWSVKVRHRYERGDVVVLWAPDAPRQQIVKRLVALEGDTLLVTPPPPPPPAATPGGEAAAAAETKGGGSGGGDGGGLFGGGGRKRRRAKAAAAAAAAAAAEATTVPEGRCWVEGDNAAESLDSRSAYGPVHLGLLEGRVLCVVWPPSRLGRVEARPPPPERLLHRAGDGERDAL